MKHTTARGGAEGAPDLAKLGALMRAAGFIASEADPVRGRVARARDGRLRRFHAHYANGWRATLAERASGDWDLSQTFRATVRFRSHG